MNTLLRTVFRPRPARFMPLAVRTRPGVLARRSHFATAQTPPSPSMSETVRGSGRPPRTSPQLSCTRPRRAREVHGSCPSQRRQLLMWGLAARAGGVVTRSATCPLMLTTRRDVVEIGLAPRARAAGGVQDLWCCTARRGRRRGGPALREFLTSSAKSPMKSREAGQVLRLVSQHHSLCACGPMHGRIVRISEWPRHNPRARARRYVGGGQRPRTSPQLFYMCPRRTHEVGAVSVIPETTCPHAGLDSWGKRRRGAVGDAPSSRVETPPRRHRDRARPMCDGVAGRGTRRGQCTGVCPCTMASREGASAESWGTAQDNGRARYRRPCWAKRTEPPGLPLMHRRLDFVPSRGASILARPSTRSSRRRMRFRVCI